jgi:hypothetical protein
MSPLTPSCLIISNVNENSGTFVSQQPANDFMVQFRTPIFLTEESQIGIKSIQFESAQEILIDSGCNRLLLHISGGGAPNPFGIAYPGDASNVITLTLGNYTIETLCEHISNQIMAALGNPLIQMDEHFGVRCYFAAKGFIWFEFVRDESADYGIPILIQLWTDQPALANILGLAVVPTFQESELHELSGATGPVHNIVCDYQPYLNRSLTGYSPCVLVEIQNLRMRSMNSYIKNNVNIVAKVPLYSAPAEPYVQYEPSETIFFKPQQVSLTELRFRLLNLDMTLHKCTNQKPTIIVLEILPVQ